MSGFLRRLVERHATEPVTRPRALSRFEAGAPPIGGPPRELSVPASLPEDPPSAPGRGTVVELAQANSNVAIPLFVSTLGYGVLWNTASKSWFDNRFPTELKLSAEASRAVDEYVDDSIPPLSQIMQRWREALDHKGSCEPRNPLTMLLLFLGLDAAGVY